MTINTHKSPASGNWRWRGLSARIGGATLVVAASALAIGPDTWMEWVMWGTTVISVSAMRVLLIVLAAIVLVAVAWPLMRRPPLD